jgi:hypothetical protein
MWSRWRAVQKGGPRSLPVNGERWDWGFEKLGNFPALAARKNELKGIIRQETPEDAGLRRRARVRRAGVCRTRFYCQQSGTRWALSRRLLHSHFDFRL